MQSRAPFLSFVLVTLLCADLNPALAALEDKLDADEPKAGNAPQASEAPLIEILPLEEDRWVLVLPGANGEQPLQTEIQRGLTGGWSPSDGSVREDQHWQTAWAEVLNAENTMTAEQLWDEALDRLESDPLPARVAFTDPDIAVVLRTRGDKPARLSVLRIENWPLSRGQKGWDMGDIDVERIFALPAADKQRMQIWQKLFYPVPPQETRPTLDKSTWLSSLLRLGNKDAVVYRQANGKLIRVLRERTEGPSWQPQVFAGTEPESTLPPEETPRAPSGDTGKWQPGWLFYLLIFLPLGFLNGFLVARVFPNLLKRPKDTFNSVTTLPVPELIDRLHLEAEKKLGEPASEEPEWELQRGALAFARKLYLKEASALSVQAVPNWDMAPVVQDPLKPSREEKEAQQKDVAKLGSFVLKEVANRYPKGAPSISKARDYFVYLLRLADDIENEKSTSQSLKDQNKTLSTRVAELAEETNRLRAEQGVLAADKRKLLDDQIASYERVKKSLEDKTRQAETQLNDEREELRKTQAEFDRQSRVWAQEKKKLNDAFAKSQEAEAQLTRSLAAEQNKSHQYELAVEELRKSLDQAERSYADFEQERGALEKKLRRVQAADQYVHDVQLAFWDRCRHPAAAAALLYNAYLGLFQILSGAVQRNDLLETTGWMNLRNLMLRVGQVPGLERWQQGFAPGVYPSLDAEQIPEGQIADRKQEDRERDVLSRVLQNLLAGEVQFGGTVDGRFDLGRLRGWPIFYKVKDGRVWSAS